MSVSFTDPDAGENMTNGYTVVIENKKLAGSVDVEFEEHSLVCETPYVLSTDSDFKITLKLDGKITALTKDDVSLNGSFKGLDVDNVTFANVSDGANVTLQLSGELVKDETANIYTDGVVYLSANAIKNANEAVSAQVPVETLSAYFIGEQLKKDSNGLFTLPLVLIDCGEVSAKTLNKEDIKFYKTTVSGDGNSAQVVEGLADIGVSDVKPGDTDTQALLTLNITGADDRNEAAAALNGTTVKIGDFGFTANVAPASFYPVFDYVTKSGDNFEFTLELYAHSGAFKSGLAATDIGFAGGFAGATDTAVSNATDSTAELKFKIPANGADVDDLNIDGTVILKAGALKNMWGDASTEDVQNARNYSQDSMGKYTLLGSGDVAILKDIVGGFGNTTAGTVAAVASGAASAGTAILTILDITGIMPNKTSQTLTLLKEVNEKINSIQDQLNRQSALMQDIQRSIYDSDLSSFDTQIANLNTLNNIVSGFLATAAKDSSLNLDAFPLSETELKQLQVKEKDSTVRYKYKDDGLTAEQTAALKEYTSDLVQAVLTAEKDGKPAYRGFEDSFKQLNSTYRNVMAQLTKTNDQNPMAVFDKLCSYTFNFSTSAYGTRYAQRLNIANAVERALDNIALYYGCDSNNSVFKSAADSYDAFLKLINDDSSKYEGKIGNFAVVQKTYKWNENPTTYSYILNRDVFLSDKDIYEENNKWWSEQIRYPYFVGVYWGYYNNYAFYSDGYNYTDDQIQEFVRRMNGRTLKEELELAGFTGTITEAGFIFKAWTKDDGEYRWWQARYANKYYAIVIKLNSNKAEQITRAEEVGGTFLSKPNKLYILPAFWYSPWRK